MRSRVTSQIRDQPRAKVPCRLCDKMKKAGCCTIERERERDEIHLELSLGYLYRIMRKAKTLSLILLHSGVPHPQ